MWRYLRTPHTWRPIVSTLRNSLRGIATESHLNAFKFLCSTLTKEKANSEIILSNRLILGETLKERLDAIAQSDVTSSDTELHAAMSFLVSPGVLVEDLLQAGNQSVKLPSWLLLYVLHHSVETAGQVQRAWELVQICLPEASPAMKCLLLVSSAHRLADFELCDNLVELVQVGVKYPEAMIDNAYDLLIRVFVRLPTTDSVQECITRVLDLMTIRKIALPPRVLDLLLQSNHFTVDIGLAVDRCNTSQGAMPSARHTEEFLRRIGFMEEHSLSSAPPSGFIEEMGASFDHPAFTCTGGLVTASSHQDLATRLRDANLLQWRWLYVAVAPSIQSAYDRLQQVLGRELGEGTVRTPDWLLLYLLRTKVHDEHDAGVAFRLVDTYQHTVSTPLSTCLLSIAAYWCAKCGAIVFLRRILQRFLSPPSRTRLDFDFLLRALAYAPPDKETSVLVRSLLSVMKERSMAASPKTIDHLFGDVLTLDVATEVERDAKLHGRHFTRKQLEALIALSARTHRRKKAAWYLRLLHRTLQQENPHLFPVGSDSKQPPLHGLVSQDRVYMQSFRRYRALRRYVLLMARTHATQPSRIATISRSPNGKALSIVNESQSAEAEMPSELVSAHANETRTLPTPSVLASPAELSVKDWTATLYVASRDRAVTADAFRDLVRKGVDELKLTPTHVTYHVTMRGFLKKGAIRQALMVWREFCSSGLALDTLSLGLGVNILTVNGLASEAFDMLEYVYSRQDKRRAHKTKTSRNNAFVNPIALNSFLIGLSRIARPDVIYELWLNTERLYDIRPDVYTLNILLGAARWAVKYNDTLRGTLTELGFMRYPLSGTSPLDTVGREEIVKCIQGLLDPRGDHRVLGFWEGHSAGKVALRIAFDLCLQNWPELKDVESPVRALRSSSSAQLTAPISDVFHSFQGGPESLPTLGTALPTLTENVDTKLRYSRIVPTNVTFRLILDLLEAESLSAEIPLVLAWMRALNIAPSKSTLATALAYWTDIGSDAPLIEVLKGGKYQSPYERLTDWMRDWVGERNMPQGQHVQMERRRIRYYRETSYRDMVNRRREGLDDVD